MTRWLGQVSNQDPSTRSQALINQHAVRCLTEKFDFNYTLTSLISPIWYLERIFRASNEWPMSWNTVVASIPGMNRQRLAIVKFPSMRCNITTVLSQTNLNMQRTNLQLSNKVLLAFWASLICYSKNNYFLKIVFIPVSLHVNFKDFKHSLSFLLNGESFWLEKANYGLNTS